MRKGAVVYALLLLACCTLTSCAAERVTSVDASTTSLAQVIAALRGADIVILGEVHDNAEHHRNQALIIRKLGPAAVTFEMLSPEQAVLINQSRDRDAALREALDWDNSGWPQWSLYQPVFAALGDIPAYGAALPREQVSAAVTDGAAAVFGADAREFGLTAALAEDQQQTRESQQQTAHCNMLPATLLPGMVEAQRLRDAAFARTTLGALAERGSPVVVIAGTGHARTDWGMPAALRQAAPNATIASLGQLEEAPDGTPPFDTWLVTEAAPREDPCIGFAMPGEKK